MITKSDSRLNFKVHSIAFDIPQVLKEKRSLKFVSMLAAWDLRGA